ncbi:MAG: matrixin family metalloprotease [Gemmatimonadaceae bacterium]
MQTISVRIDSAADLADWNASYRADVVDALRAWEAPGSPVRFVIVSGSRSADITVHWVARFPARYEGWTTVSWDHSGWLTSADVSLALENPAGELLTPAARSRVAMHELGHALGLSHSTDGTSIMAPTVRTRSIGPDDIRTLRDLYADQPWTVTGLVATRRDARGGSQCAAPAG